MSKERTPHKKTKEMTPEERLQWLRERGVQVVTSEERRASKVSGALREAEILSKHSFSYVSVPADTSKPLLEFTATYPSDWNRRDYLLEHLKPYFCGGGDDVDIELLNQQTTGIFAGPNAPSVVSDTALRDVALQGNVESFSLVHPGELNDFTGINIYLDEIGMLKRRPLNTRVMEYARRAGYDPSPQFYGDVFLGRIRKQKDPGMIQNQSFCLGIDTNFDAGWLKTATRDNLAYQTVLNRLTGENKTQPALDGTDGKARQEDSFSWTQTEEELEIALPLPNYSSPKQVQVLFRLQSVHVVFQDAMKFVLQLFQPIDIEGCAWTVERNSNGGTLTMTMQKLEAALWPRVRD